MAPCKPIALPPNQVDCRQRRSLVLRAPGLPPAMSSPQVVGPRDALDTFGNQARARGLSLSPKQSSEKIRQGRPFCVSGAGLLKRSGSACNICLRQPSNLNLRFKFFFAHHLVKGKDVKWSQTLIQHHCCVWHVVCASASRTFEAAELGPYTNDSMTRPTPAGVPRVRFVRVVFY